MTNQYSHSTCKPMRNGVDSVDTTFTEILCGNSACGVQLFVFGVSFCRQQRESNPVCLNRGVLMSICNWLDTQGIHVVSNIIKTRSDVAHRRLVVFHDERRTWERERKWAKNDALSRQQHWVSKLHQFSNRRICEKDPAVH